MYEIKPYTYQRAREMDLEVFPSDNKKYKIGVYDWNTGLFMFYGGASGFSDYPTYLETHGKEYADKRRALYHKRHSKEIANKGSRAWVIAQLLW